MQSVPITTNVVSSNLDQGGVYNIMWSSFSVTCNRPVLFFGYSGFLTNKTDRHEITEIWLRGAVSFNKQTNKHWPCHCIVHIYVVIHFCESIWSFLSGGGGDLCTLRLSFGYICITVWKKNKLNSEKIWKIWRKSQ